MNGSQPQGQQAPQPQQRNFPLYRPEQMRTLPDNFTAEEKAKWEHGLMQLYKTMETNPHESQAHMDARKKVQDFSLTLQRKIQMARQQGQIRPNQGASAQVPGGVAAMSQEARPVPGQPQRPSPEMINHINSFPYVYPPQIIPGTPEATKWLTETKNKYGKALIAMEGATVQLRQMEALQKQRNEQGRPLNPEELKNYELKKDMNQKTHADARKFVETFREQQKTAGQQNGTNQSQAPTRPTLNLQQQAPNTAQQNTQTVNAAFDAARNQQQMNGARPPIPAAQNDAMSQAANMMQSQGANIKQEGVPQINTAMAQAPHIQQRQSQNSPQTAGPPQSATSAGVPKPLTQQGAIAAASRTYSSSQALGSGTPNVMASTQQHQSMTRDNNISTVKMPIPKQLPPSAVGPPHAVQMQSSRPTMSGGPNSAGNGVMSQPVLQKHPGFTIEGEGERVLNKKKLDELVRQVTGGGEGLDSGEGLTPEVEDCVLSVADEFVDQVIMAACKCAKARGAKMLEIRDIQLILERNYNIRIPGYASDEIRTVRKFQPAPGWINKMSAIQAAKVTGGKGDL